MRYQHRYAYRNQNRDRTQTVLYTAGATAAALLAARAVYRYATAYDFRGKVVLITGGSRGLGLVMARELAREGASLAICARHDNEVQRARDELVRQGADVLAVQCDVTVGTQVEGMVRGILDHFGRIDVLINNAGTIAVGPVDTMTVADYDEAMRTHFWAPLFCTMAVVPHMRARGEGRIVNISSIGGKVAVPHLLPYCASKFALTGFSEGLRAELKRDGIVVTTICPGLMRTGSPRNAFFKGRHRQEYLWFSLGDALPVTSMSARRAARKIINACRHGDAERVLSIQAKFATTFHGLFPGLTADLSALVNRLLPGPGGIGTAKARGFESQSELVPSVLTTLSDRAAAENNEM